MLRILLLASLVFNITPHEGTVFAQDEAEEIIEDEFGDEDVFDDDEEEDEPETVPIGVPLRADPKQHKVEPLDHLWSDASNTAPAMSPDGRYIVFQSNRDDEARFSLYETIDDKGWSEPRMIVLNRTATFEGQPFFSGHDGWIFYASITPANYHGADVVNIPADIWVSRYKKGKWSKPRHLPTPINTEVAELTPWVSFDGQKLYFSSNRPGGFGGYDIWVSDRSPDGWGEPYNIGREVNSGGDEIYPRLHPDSSVLYFSSNRAGGVGGFDIYLSRRRGERWRKGLNAGSFINTHSNEFLNSIPAHSKYVLFSRGDEGEEKIYKVEPVPEFMRPASVAIVRFIVLDHKSKIPQPFKIEIKNEKTNRIILQKKHTPRSRTPYGKRNEKGGQKDPSAEYFSRIGFYAPLTVPGKYNFFITSGKHLFADKELEIKTWSGEEIKKIYYLKRLRKGTSITLRNILFLPNKAVMKRSSKKTLLRVARYLSNNPGIHVELQGHTTVGGGTPATRLRLSLNRARAVKRALVEYGIEGKRLSTKGFGARKRIYANNSKKNRRVEFKITKTGN